MVFPLAWLRNRSPIALSAAELHDPQDSDIVIERSKSHSPSVRLSILLMALGFCVFLWGFSYKISLYNLNQRSLHTVPDAKLLSKNEDRQAAGGVQQVLAKAESPQLILLLDLVAITSALIGACAARWAFREQRVAGLKPHIGMYTPSLYFRPPPIQSVL